jgi:hypothetical membrane protein
MQDSQQHANLSPLSGPLAAVVLAVGIAGLALMVPGYSQVHQTVSEIGQMGSPARVSFAALLCAVAVCLLIFAWEIRALSLKMGSSQAGAYLIACMAVSAAGVGVFAHPHPLHNVFGLSELIGYQAPIALAVAWRRRPQARSVVLFSWFMAFLVWVAIAMNLATLDRSGALWAFEKPYYGLVQRVLFAAWFGWCAGIGFILYRMRDAAVQQKLS